MKCHPSLVSSRLWGRPWPLSVRVALYITKSLICLFWIRRPEQLHAPWRQELFSKKHRLLINQANMEGKVPHDGWVPILVSK